MEGVCLLTLKATFFELTIAGQQASRWGTDGRDARQTTSRGLIGVFIEDGEGSSAYGGVVKGRVEKGEVPERRVLVLRTSLAPCGAAYGCLLHTKRSHIPVPAESPGCQDMGARHLHISLRV